MARRTPEPAGNIARGAILVVVAVVVGFLLLRNGIDTEVTRTADRAAAPATEPEEEVTEDGGTDAGVVDPGTTDAGGTDQGTDMPVEPPETEAPRPRDQVMVIVLNGSGVTGEAGRWSDGIGLHGYQMVPAGNADGRVELTQVLHQPGFEADAARLVADLGSPSGVSPQPLPPEPPGDIGEAQLVVVVGPDIVDADPPPPTG